jgi:chromosome segregation ATPase
MGPEQAYLALNERRATLLQKRAVLEAQEAEKSKRREEIRKQLAAAGIDPDRPEEEKKRLEREAEEALRESTRELDEFERRLNEAETPNTTTTLITKPITSFDTPISPRAVEETKKTLEKNLPPGADDLQTDLADVVKTGELPAEELPSDLEID